MAPFNTDGKTIKSTKTAFDIIEMIAREDRPTTSQIASEIEYSRSTTHYHLQTLQQNRYVVHDGDGFRLGLRIAHLGNMAVRQHRLGGMVEQVADDLAADTGRIAQVAVMEAGEGVWLYSSGHAELEEWSTEVGTGFDLHATAYGQAILAYLSEETADEWITAHDLRSHTERTPTSRDALEEQLSTVREHRFAYSSDEFVPGITTLAAPILGEKERTIIGAIGITDHTDRIDDPYRHTKAKRFSDEPRKLVQRAARLTSDRLSD
ncbi:IclR family transcriptional regulator [Halopenitus salinus]|uniref:IclR family transcriptional regulator n=1 Tax=Halopenitus salinus TaxID=1198295 RepID=A0ABD5UUV8_9EURY